MLHLFIFHNLGRCKLLGFNFRGLRWLGRRRRGQLLRRLLLLLDVLDGYFPDLFSGLLTCKLVHQDRSQQGQQRNRGRNNQGHQDTLVVRPAKLVRPVILIPILKEDIQKIGG